MFARCITAEEVAERLQIAESTFRNKRRQLVHDVQLPAHVRPAVAVVVDGGRPRVVGGHLEHGSLAALAVQPQRVAEPLEVAEVVVQPAVARVLVLPHAEATRWRSEGGGAPVNDIFSAGLSPVCVRLLTCTILEFPRLCYDSPNAVNL